MKKKNKFLLTMGVAIATLFVLTLVVSADIGVPGNFSGFSITDYSSYEPYDLFMIHNFTLYNGYRYLDVSILSINQKTYNALSRQEFLESLSTASSYIDYQTTGYISYLKSQTTLAYSNVNEFCEILDNIGQVMKQDYNDYDTLHTDYLIYYNNYNNLVVEYDDISYQLFLLQNDYNSKLFEIDTLNTLITDYKANISILELELMQTREEIAETGNYYYNKGYNAGLNDSDVIERGFMQIFNAPMYVLQEMFNFELFGINFYNILKFFLTIGVVYFAIKIFI